AFASFLEAGVSVVPHLLLTPIRTVCFVFRAKACALSHARRFQDAWTHRTRFSGTFSYSRSNWESSLKTAPNASMCSKAGLTVGGSRGQGFALLRTCTRRSIGLVGFLGGDALLASAAFASKDPGGAM